MHSCMPQQLHHNQIRLGMPFVTMVTIINYVILYVFFMENENIYLNYMLYNK
jgi:hypothetical protein